ncbi:MAG: transferase [Deltaproteobacteria bacterium CG_4_8_14_3_um_filter_51_11]|nr:transferase [bacterium]OIP37090.1 MAG: transferase [Desulfobacteraceae bacterium CG2_30_51_40]PIX18313.1 MAG: transferase [Deltaproteobacteria bacterium CG_4_8_14_3_um_filter_51_11]PIY25644.1 MAG: transferase [Deltaproteobacteria bacterium CG_4_10_14_3_um_filter_51_14]PJB36596.1 MAG: transferase [Deltaproteobacteria bacterium CG_4_9_14_3_um_filter_51_14]
MRELEKTLDRITERVNINLRERRFDAGPYIRNAVPLTQMLKFYAYYGLTHLHPLHFRFSRSSLAGSYFLGKCTVDDSVIYKSNVRGDELKAKGETIKLGGMEMTVFDDEVIRIKDSMLIKNLVHNFSHDPEDPEDFTIRNTASFHYANIHGSPVEGCFLGPFSTIDLTTVHDCVIGPYAYLQVGEIAHKTITPGRLWIRAEGFFEFTYQYPADKLNRYVFMEPGGQPGGVFIDFINRRKSEFQKVFDLVKRKVPLHVPQGTSLSHYAVVKGKTHLSENVLVAEKAYLEDAWMGTGANAQENCYIIRSNLEGYNVTAHGASVIDARLGSRVFVGFNSFLRGRENAPLIIGANTIVMPHTIIDGKNPVEIPGEHLVWGLVRQQEDLETHSIPLERLVGIDGTLQLGDMTFEGSGSTFVERFRQRIEHILEANGAFFDGSNGRGHAQKTHDISYNTIQPYQEGRLKGLYPTIEIWP